MKKYLNESERLDALYEYEKKHYASGGKIIAGVDEVGRGPLAGPVVAACVVLPEDCRIEGINDSKKLSAKRREELYKVIQSEALFIGIGIVEPDIIDEINILEATYKAMKEAIYGLSVTPCCVLVDGYPIPSLGINQEAIIKGDSKSISIASASIIAKVTRDEMMLGLHGTYPQYCFDKNKGYGTKKHMDAIAMYGLCPHHRRSFTRKMAVGTGSV